MTTGEPWHGTNRGYASWGCRCDDCKAAHAADKRAYRAANKSQSRTGDEPWHGTLNGYGYRGCRCDLCKEANAANIRAYRKKPGVRDRQNARQNARRAARKC